MLKEFKSMHHPEQSHAQGWKEPFVFRNLKSPTSPKWHLEGLTQKTPKNRRNESFAPAFAVGALERERESLFFLRCSSVAEAGGKGRVLPSEPGLRFGSEGPAQLQGCRSSQVGQAGPLGEPWQRSQRPPAHVRLL